MGFLSIKDLSQNVIFAANLKFWPKLLQSFLAYLIDKPQNLFNNFVSKFEIFATKAHFATGP